MLEVRCSLISLHRPATKENSLCLISFVLTFWENLKKWKLITERDWGWGYSAYLLFTLNGAKFCSWNHNIPSTGFLCNLSPSPRTFFMISCSRLICFQSRKSISLCSSFQTLQLFPYFFKLWYHSYTENSLLLASSFETFFAIKCFKDWKGSFHPTWCYRWSPVYEKNFSLACSSSLMQVVTVHLS